MTLNSTFVYSTVLAALGIFLIIIASVFSVLDKNIIIALGFTGCLAIFVSLFVAAKSQCKTKLLTRE